MPANDAELLQTRLHERKTRKLEESEQNLDNKLGFLLRMRLSTGQMLFNFVSVNEEKEAGQMRNWELMILHPSYALVEKSVYRSSLNILLSSIACLRLVYAIASSSCLRRLSGNNHSIFSAACGLTPSGAVLMQNFDCPARCLAATRSS
jgi:hypothetical protein